MALGPDNFNVTVSLDSIFCFQGDDIDDIFDEESEPYLWVLMIKLDGEGLFQAGNFLVGSPRFFFSPGSHGNIGGSILRGTRRLPHEVGRWETSLKPIPISVAGQQLTSIPGTILCCAVLMEENLTPNSAVEAAHTSIKQLVEKTIESTLASLGLAGLAADAVAEVASSGNTITLAVAASRVLQRRLKPIQDLFTLAAPANTAVTILKNLKLDGLIGSAIDADKPMGVFFRSLGQAELAGTVEGTGGGIDLGASMFNMPEWAYNLHGRAWAHHKFVRTGIPSSTRLQVTCSSKRALGQGQKRITGIGGQDNGVFWGLSRGEAANLIRKDEKTFFVVGPDGRSAEVAAVSGGFVNGTEWFFIQTLSDQNKGNNLVNLPDCPAGAFTVEVWF